MNLFVEEWFNIVESRKGGEQSVKKMESIGFTLLNGEALELELNKGTSTRNRTARSLRETREQRLLHAIARTA